jgi:periplasmic protein CpxP/Spy
MHDLGRFLLAPCTASALLTSIAAAAIAPAFARAPPPPTASQAAATVSCLVATRSPQSQRLAAKRIQSLKIALKITPAQEALWRRVAGAMRVNAWALERQNSTCRHRGPPNALERISAREYSEKTRAENDARFLAAFGALYAKLSPEQQHTADRLIAPQHATRGRA